MKKKLHFNENSKLFSTILLALICLFGAETAVYANSTSKEIQKSLYQLNTKKVTLNINNGTIKAILFEIQKQTKLSFVYKDEVIKSLGTKSINVLNETVENVLKMLFEGSDVTYSFNDNIISLTKKATDSTKGGKTVTVKGKVIDQTTKAPIVGATVMVVGTNNGAVTNDEGLFTFSAKDGDKIEVSYVGSKPLIATVGEKPGDMILILESDALAVDDVIVTSIFTRKKESFTGSAAVYTAKDLKTIGNTNVLQSLKTLDPSFAILENNIYGSDPNRLPDIEIRGKTSVVGLSSEYGTDPNQPLFILDGFESTLSTISDLSMDRIQSIVVLKDAAATAIYGSKAANGVVVVETKVPEAGKLSISYNGNFGVSFADLTDYNLMNSSEKLEFERLSGYYGTYDANGRFDDEIESEKYYKRKAEIVRGVDSYWLNEPLRTAFNHSHNLYAEGGENKIRYGVGFSYGDNKGVMKGSGRETLNGNVRLIYRSGNLSFSNQTSLDYSMAKKEKVSFSEFAKANPYFRKYNADGDILKVLEKFTIFDSSAELWYKDGFNYNPMYNASLGSFDNTSTMGITNNTDVDWSITKNLKAKARFSVNKKASRQTQFKSPDHTDYEGVNRLKRGSYTRNNGDDLSYDGDFNITYGKLFANKHMLNIVGGFRMNQKSNTYTGYITEGFIDDEFSNPAFSNGYSSSAVKPKYAESVTRSANFYINGGYSYDNRYMLDVNYRSDGSSVFGSSKRFTTTWSAGLGWNIHREKFMKNINWLTVLKLRGTIGNPGNQNFDAAMSLKTYTYNNALQNHFGISTIISKLGNSNLEWQKTLDKNLGVDIELFNRKLMVTFDTYNKTTDPLLVYITMPTSSGTNSVPRNIGKQESKGYTISATYRIIQSQNLNWNINANTRHEKSTYENIGNSLSSNNKENTSKNLIRYYDGASTTALWAVRSAGIDPATGREVFYKRSGSQTFVHDYEDEVVVGDSKAKFEGVIGTSLYYKGFSLSVNLRYRHGGDTFMNSLYDKVENISETSIRYNQDKRALSDRWQKPGMKAKFKSISITETTPMSSRFIAQENTLTGESISVGYEMQNDWLNGAGISSLTLKAYMNDIFRISSIKNERGIEYPFERSVSFSLGIRF